MPDDDRSPWKPRLGGNLLRIFEKLDENRRKELEEKHRLESLPPKFVIHTVHGTFAAKATWIEPESDICSALRRQLGWRAKIVPFRWSGKNTVSARRQAAEDLKKRLTRILKTPRFKDAHHVVIAHSHGGNVAFMALDSPELAKQVLGVATLATPFLYASLRSEDNLIDPFLGLFAGLFAGGAVLALGLGLGMGFGLWPWALLAVVCILGMLSLGAWLDRCMQHHAKKLCDLMPRTALSPEQVTVIRVQGDEALAAIAGAGLAGRLADLIWRIATSHVFEILTNLLNFIDYGKAREARAQREEQFARKIDDCTHDPADSWKLAFERREPTFQSVSSQIGVQYLPLAVLWLFQEGGETLQLLAMILFCIYSLPAAGAVAIVALGVPFGLLSAMSLLPCGLTVPLAGAYLRLVAEPSPQGTWTVTNFKANDQATSLWHSEAYQNPEAWCFLGDWIDKQANARQSTLPSP